MNEDSVKKIPDNKGFNYCFWAKLLVAIPLIPLAAVVGAGMFEDTIMQIVGGVLGVAVVFGISKLIDSIPGFDKPIGS